MRSLACSFGLLTAAAMGVHVSGGVTEAHFSFFVVVVLLTLYEDWTRVRARGPLHAAPPRRARHVRSPGRSSPPRREPLGVGRDPRRVRRGRRRGRGRGVAAQRGRPPPHARDPGRAARRGHDRQPHRPAQPPPADERPRGRRDDDPEAQLALFDLDGFKAYNDTFGHLAGDALLTRLGTRLREAVGQTRHGVPPRRRRVLRARLRRAERGDDRGRGGGAHRARRRVHDRQLARQPWRWATRSASPRTRCGSSTSACTSARTAGAGRPATRARPCSCGRWGSDTPTSARTAPTCRDWPSSSRASSDVAEDQLESIRHAAELHDVGKVGIPDAILSKPGAARRRRVGLHAAPHDHRRAHRGRCARARARRPPGALEPRALGRRRLPRPARRRGHPDRLPDHRGLRRLRRHALGPSLQGGGRASSDALAELRRCAGTQFDPAVVEAFCAVMADELVAVAA